VRPHEATGCNPFGLIQGVTLSRAQRSIWTGADSKMAPAWKGMRLQLLKLNIISLDDTGRHVSKVQLGVCALTCWKHRSSMKSNEVPTLVSVLLGEEGREYGEKEEGRRLVLIIERKVKVTELIGACVALRLALGSWHQQSQPHIHICNTTTLIRSALPNHIDNSITGEF